MFKYFNQVGVDLIDMKGFLVFQKDCTVRFKLSHLSTKICHSPEYDCKKKKKLKLVPALPFVV